MENILEATSGNLEEERAVGGDRQFWGRKGALSLGGTGGGGGGDSEKPVPSPCLPFFPLSLLYPKLELREGSPMPKFFSFSMPAYFCLVGDIPYIYIQVVVTMMVCLLDTETNSNVAWRGGDETCNSCQCYCLLSSSFPTMGQEKPLGRQTWNALPNCYYTPKLCSSSAFFHFLGNMGQAILQGLNLLIYPNRHSVE